MTISVRVSTGTLLLCAAAQAVFLYHPCLQNLTDSSVAVRWTSIAAESGRVEYGLTSSYGQEVSDPGPAVDHELTLSGLVADTCYHYRVISGADTSTDRVFSSRVSPRRSFRFLVYGDNHSNDSAAHQRVVDRMLQVEQAAFVANTGDLTSSGLSSQYRQFFSIERGLLSRMALEPAIGNHDADSLPNWFRFMSLPGNERWYSYRSGSAAFHSLDVNVSFAPGSEQYEWLLSELAADSADPNVRHVFVYFHYPAYTTSTAYAGNTQVREYLCPLFERYGVAVVFSGHVHAYEHSRVNDVHYVITGGGGGTLATGWNAAQPWTVYREATYEFVLVDVMGDTVLSRGVRPDGSEFDSLLIVSGTVGADESKGPRPVPRPAPAVLLGSTRVRLDLSAAACVRVALFDAAGRACRRLPALVLPAGGHVIDVSGPGLEPGVYTAVIRADNRVLNVRMVVPD
jgi:predicted phosphodiesterase